MSDDEIRDALERAADVVPDRDLSQTAWYAGRSRKRRTSRAWWGAGAAAAAAAVIGTVAWGGGLTDLDDSGPAGTAGDDAAQTSETGLETADEQPMSGQPAMLIFTSEKGELQNSGVMEPWSPVRGSATTWHLTDDLMWLVDPEQAEEHDPNVTLTLEQDVWSVRGCGLAMRAPGSLADGRVAITGDWEVDPDPDPGASCVWNEWLDAERWKSLLSGSPLVAQDGTTLLLSGALGEQPVRDRVSVGFVRSEATDPQVGPGRAATWDDLGQDWVEAPLGDLTAHIPDRPFVDTETDPEADLQLTSPELGVLSITGCDGRGFTQSWLLDAGDTAHFLDPFEFFTAHHCDGPGTRQQSLVTFGMLASGAEISVHGDYLVIDSWVDPAVLDPQPPVEETRPELLAAPMLLPDLKELTRSETLLPEVLAVPADGIPTLVEDPTDSFAVAAVSEDHDNALLVLGSDHRWRTAATGVGGVTRDGLLMSIPPLLDMSISPTGEWLAFRTAFRTDASVVIVSAATGEAREFATDGEFPGNFPDDFLWLDDDRLAVDLREDRGMIIDVATEGVTHDAAWNQLQEITPWRIAVQNSDDDPTGPVVLRQRDTAGKLVDEIPLGFDGTPGGGPALAGDRVAYVVTTEDPAVIEPEGWQGEVPESVSLVLAYDGTEHYVNVLQAEAHTVAPVRWVDRGTLIVQVIDDGTHHYVLWDTQNGGTQLLTEADLPVGHGPVFGDVGG